jgi:hypothetical protein
MSALPTAWPAVAATLLTVLWANHGRSNLKLHCEMNREIVCLSPTLATMIEAQSTEMGRASDRRSERIAGRQVFAFAIPIAWTSP